MWSVSRGRGNISPVVAVPGSVDFAGTLGIEAWDGALPGLGDSPSKPTAQGGPAGI